MSADSDAIRVLHVDDEPEFGELVETFLQREDDRFEVETVTSSREGLERLEEREFDCVVSDYDMPGDNGIEFLSALREAYPDLPFILFTGKGSEAVASDAISAGVTDYLQKEAGTDQYAILANRIQHTVEGYRARQRIEASERRLRNVYERITDGFFAVNADWEYEYVNEEGAALTGRTRAKLVGTSVWEAFPELIDSPFESALRTAMEEQTSASVEEYYPAHDSWYDVRVYGDEAGISIYFQDVTERVERRRELRETKQRFELALDHAGGGVWEWNVETDELFWDENLLGHLGIQPSAFEGSFGFFEDRLHPADEPRVWERIEAALATGSPYSVELRMRDDDGEWRWFDIRGQAVRGSDADRMVGVALDITDRKERERELERIQEFLQHLYSIATDRALSPEEKIARLLESGPEKLGLPHGYLTRIEQPDDDPEGGTQTIVQTSGDHDLLQPGDTSPLSHSYCRKTIEQPGLLEVGDAMAEGWRDDPAYETFELGCYVGTPITVDDELYGTVFFGSVAPRAEPFTDAERTFVQLMSQLVSYELERKRAAEEQERRTERLEQFASVVSHDLRNPLGVAQGRLELAREDREWDHQEGVERAHDRMETLIDDLLTLAREGDRITGTEAVDLDDLVTGCWETVATADATLDVALSRSIRADRSRLAQLFENLLGNAVEHGGDDVTITVGELETGFYVADDGPGIPAAQRADVFEPGVSNVDGGTGVGLAIVEEIADAHGWRVAVTESERGGARFEITGVSFSGE
jgi:PAS domain S-box-containing protein